MKNLKLNLTLFDSNPNTTEILSEGLKTYYSNFLIDNAKPNLVHDQFGQKHTIPKNGGSIINFRRYIPFSKATTPLSEGVTPDGGTLSVTNLSSNLSEYGYYVTISDMLSLTSVDNTIVETTKLLGNQAGVTLDTITREVLNGGTNVIYANGTPSRPVMSEESKLQIDDLYKAARYLKLQNAPKIDGYYVGIIHPDVATTLMRNNEWIDINKYAHSDNIFEGEIGKIAGIRFIETSEAKVFEYNGNTIYSTLILGANAYGITEVEGGGLKTIIKQLGSGGTADPLNQRATVGWKAMKTAERLVENYMIRIESTTDYDEVVPN